jgi:hypothetical protein
MMPLMTSRFRRGFTPRRYIGIEASIEAYCSSLSQNRFDIVARSLNVEASNRTRCSHVKQKLGSEPNVNGRYLSAKVSTPTATRSPIRAGPWTLPVMALGRSLGRAATNAAAR